MPELPASIGPYRCGPGQPLLVIAGPCVIESEQLTLQIAGRLKEVAAELPINLVFKASFDKANRTSVESYRGPGLAEGLRILQCVRETTGLPVTTDIHEPSQATAAGGVCELLQIPAFLARQTDLLVAAAATGRAVHVKKGQFMAPWDMRLRRRQARSGRVPPRIAGRAGILLRLWPAGQRHAVDSDDAVAGRTGRIRRHPQCPGAGRTRQRHGGQPRDGRAACPGRHRHRCRRAVFETHPDPDAALSDGPNMIPLNEMGRLLERLVTIRRTVEKFAC